MNPLEFFRKLHGARYVHLDEEDKTLYVWDGEYLIKAYDENGHETDLIQLEEPVESIKTIQWIILEHKEGVERKE